MNAHPSSLELHDFVRTGRISGALEAHLRGCDACSRKLSGMARRVAGPAVVIEAPPALEVRAGVLALLACVAVLAVRAVHLVPVNEVVAPEGEHGVAVQSSDAGLPLPSGEGWGRG